MIKINNAKVLIDGQFQNVNIEINSGKIAKISKEKFDNAIDAKGLTLLPAFFDMHAHFREPGFEYKEDMQSGSMAAVKGGFASVCLMPNTNPVIDEPALVKYISMRQKEIDLCKIYPIACITKGQSGKQLAEVGLLKEAGAAALSDDGKPVENAAIMRNAMQYAYAFNIPVISHCEDKSLAEGGQINEGSISTATGLTPISRASEEIMVAREIVLAKTYNLPIHIAHISTKGSVELLRDAKREGVKITCETCPHYFFGTDELCQNFDTNAKVNPPLRGLEDQKAIIEGIQDGTIDAIATDHAPHSKADKNVEFQSAPFGISGLETAFAISYTALVKSGAISLQKLCELMSQNPARILNIKWSKISEGEIADLVLVDENALVTVNSQEFASKGKNTPFDGCKLNGKIVMTIVNGKIKYENKVN